MNQLQFAVECGVSERTIQNIESGRSVSESTARRIAEVLKVPLESLFTIDISPHVKPLAPGRAEYYLPFILGTWFVECHEHAGHNYRGESVAAWVHHWRCELERDGNGMCGVTKCITPGFEHARFELTANVDGSRFVHFEGTHRGGGDHFFRSILRYENDGLATRFVGGYVIYRPDYQAIFEGAVKLAREPQIK